MGALDGKVAIITGASSGVTRSALLSRITGRMPVSAQATR